MTIKDIAKLANVSQSTVSKVLNDKPDVGLETKKKVREIIERYNFVPNASGKALKEKFTHNIGVIFRRDDNPLSSNPFYSRVLEGIEAELAFNELNLVLHLIPENMMPELPRMIREKQVDGVVLVGTRRKAFVKSLQKAGVPMILIDPKIPVSECMQVLIDNENGAFLATQYLIEHGHRRVGFISGELSRLNFEQRLNGYLKALKYYNIDTEDELIKARGVEDGYELTKDLMKLSNRPTAIFAANDINAIFGYKAISDLGLKIPDDISIIGFDDIHSARMATPALTTIRVYKEELGSVAVRNLRQTVYENATTHSTTIIPVKLIERNSVRMR